MSKIVLFLFAGREENMRVQEPFLDRLLDLYPQMEVHLWDLTRRESDAAYIREQFLADRVTHVNIMDALHPGHPISCLYPGRPRRPRGWPPCTCMKHKPPYEEPYRYYAAKGEPDTIYVKIDDDVLFLETERFDHLIDPLIKHPERIISAMVINNSVSAKYLPDPLRSSIANRFSVGAPDNPKNDHRWWALHTDPEFARYLHAWFLEEFPEEPSPEAWAEPDYVRTRPGEAISINCIAFTQATMERLAPMMGDRLGDEGAVDRLLPWVCTTFRAAHLTFGPQDAAMPAGELDRIREAYTDLGRAYLS